MRAKEFDTCVLCHGSIRIGQEITWVRFGEDRGKKMHQSCYEKPRTITAKFVSRCRVCRKQILVGETCELNSSKPSGLKVRCKNCVEANRELSITSGANDNPFPATKDAPLPDTDTTFDADTLSGDTLDSDTDTVNDATNDAAIEDAVTNPIVIDTVPVYVPAVNIVSLVREWTKYVQKVRQYCKDNIPNLKITQRTTIMGAVMIVNGRYDANALVDMLMCKGCDKLTRDKLVGNCGLPVLADSHTNTAVEEQHYNFGDLMFNCKARIHTYLYGEAGSGKSYSAKVIADMLGLGYYFIAFTPQSPVTTFSGYMDGFGKYSSTNVRHWVENGGVMCMDEVDNAFNPSLIWFNNGLASGEFNFPDQPKPIKMHPDCIAIACGNTPGLGPTKEYMDRRPIDESVRSRFAFIEWNTDDRLEMGIAMKIAKGVN